MTDGQVKYQTVQENIRHNLEMEKLGHTEAAIKKEQNEINSRNVAVREHEEKRISKWYDMQAFAGILGSAFGMAESLTKSLKNVTGSMKDVGGVMGSDQGWYQGSLFA